MRHQYQASLTDHHSPVIAASESLRLRQHSGYGEAGVSYLISRALYFGVFGEYEGSVRTPRFLPNSGGSVFHGTFCLTRPSSLATLSSCLSIAASARLLIPRSVRRSRRSASSRSSTLCAAFASPTRSIVR